MWPHDVRKSDLRIDYYRGSGKGGQKRNKTSNACRITHLPTGESASSEDGRSQTKNREDAFRKLAEKLKGRMLPKVPEKENPQERIRTYHQPRNQVIDHRTGEVVSYEEVLNGRGLDKLIGRVTER